MQVIRYNMVTREIRPFRYAETEATKVDITQIHKKVYYQYDRYKTDGSSMVRLYYLYMMIICVTRGVNIVQGEAATALH